MLLYISSLYLLWTTPLEKYFKRCMIQCVQQIFSSKLGMAWQLSVTALGFPFCIVNDDKKLTKTTVLSHSTRVDMKGRFILGATISLKYINKNQLWAKGQEHVADSHLGIMKRVVMYKTMYESNKLKHLDVLWLKKSAICKM